MSSEEDSRWQEFIAGSEEPFKLPVLASALPSESEREEFIRKVSSEDKKSIVSTLSKHRAALCSLQAKMKAVKTLQEQEEKNLERVYQQELNSYMNYVDQGSADGFPPPKHGDNRYDKELAMIKERIQEEVMTAAAQVAETIKSTGRQACVAE